MDCARSYIAADVGDLSPLWLVFEAQKQIAQERSSGDIIASYSLRDSGANTKASGASCKDGKRKSTECMCSLKVCRHITGS